MRYGLAAILFVGVWLSSGVVLADAKEEANRHFQSGKELMKLEDFAGAAAELEQSMALFPTKNGLFNLANCYKALHRYGDALDAYQRLRTEFGAKMDKEMASVAKADEEQIRELVGEVRVSVSEDGAAISVDGREAGRSPLFNSLYLGPGEHVLKASMNGYRDAERRTRVVSKSRTTVTLVLEPLGAALDIPEAPANEPESEPVEAESVPPAAKPTAVAGPSQDNKPTNLTPWAWTGLGLTVVTGTVAIVTLVVSESSFSDFEKAGKRYTAGEIPITDPSLIKSKDDADLYGGLAIGFGVAAGVFAVATTVLFVLDASQEEKPDSAVALAPGAIAFRY
jgi:hypothetical protein